MAGTVPATDEACPYCDNRGDCDACEHFVCATCSGRVSWDDGGADDFPDDCSVCWSRKTLEGAPSERAA